MELRHGRGFTLVETILATVILCGVVLVLGAITNRSLGSTHLNRQYEVAMCCADKQLTLIDYMGVEEFIELGQSSGSFEDMEPVYDWSVVTEKLEIDNLYDVMLTISWVDMGRSHSIGVDTRINGIGLLEEEEEEEETESQDR